MSRQTQCSSIVRRTLVLLSLLATASALYAQHPWDASSFTADPKAILAAAASMPADKKNDATILTDDVNIKLDETGRATQTYRMVYRVDTPSGVEHWAALNYRYSPWYQKRPVVKARVITPDGFAHELDTKTLTDVAVKDRSENVF